uniref:Chorion peroxidase n=1 Tax=Anthurium amnicola TaxID=1678845 RepID=A0A1D1XVH6_9ARAE
MLSPQGAATIPGDRSGRQEEEEEERRRRKKRRRRRRLSVITMGLTFRSFIHPSLRDAYDRMTFTHKLIFLVVHGIDKLGIWHRLPVLLGLAYLEGRRTLHQKYNLLNVGKVDTTSFDPDGYPYRTDDGKYNDPNNASAGSQMTFFGRNILPQDQKDQLMDPDPFIVATKLLERTNFKDTGKQFNIIASSWIQFMIHDWIDHLEETRQIEITAPSAIASECPLSSFKFFWTKSLPTNAKGIETGHLNIRTAWWDGSVIYGSNKDLGSRLRTFIEGKIKIGDNNLLLHDDEGIAISGDIRNSWIGVSLLQALFVKEHNAVCDALKGQHPDFNDEKLYQHARLVTTAVIAKIHTIDWTVELLKTDTMLAGMRANWYGLLGKRFKSIFGYIGGSTLGPILSGLVGMKEPNNHGVPYSLTEDFVSVYRMHSLLPDILQVRNINLPPGPNKSPALSNDIKMENLVGIEGEKVLGELGFERQLVSMGHQACGALELWNYPTFFRNLVVQNPDGSERANHVDFPTLEGKVK